MRIRHGVMAVAAVGAGAAGGEVAAAQADSLHTNGAIEAQFNQTKLSFADFAGHQATAQAARAGSLDVAGPALSHDKKTLDGQIDDALRVEGADGHLARMLAKAAHITTHDGRVKYITGANVDVGRIKTVSNKEYPMSSAFNPATGALEETPNTHGSSTVMTFTMKSFPKKSAEHGKIVDGDKDKGELEVTDDVIRLNCGGQDLSGKKVSKRKKYHKIAENRFDIDVSTGVNADLAAMAASKSEAASTSTSNTDVVCGPDGKPIHVQSNSQSSAQSQASAFANAVANAKANETFHIKGKNMSFVTFKDKYSKLVNAEATALANASASSSSSSSSTSSTSVDCGPNLPPPPPVTPELPGIQISKTLLDSLKANGEFFSNVATIHGNVDRWRITVTNTGNAALREVFTETPPEGEEMIHFDGEPLGLLVNADGTATWTEVLRVGETETYTVQTKNLAMPCFTNEKNTVDVIGTTAGGKQVTGEATAEIKEENTIDCDAPDPGQGPGQPVPTDE